MNKDTALWAFVQTRASQQRQWEGKGKLPLILTILTIDRFRMLGDYYATSTTLTHLQSECIRPQCRLKKRGFDVDALIVFKYRGSEGAMAAISWLATDWTRRGSTESPSVVLQSWKSSLQPPSVKVSHWEIWESILIAHRESRSLIHIHESHTFLGLTGWSLTLFLCSPTDRMFTLLDSQPELKRLHLRLPSSCYHWHVSEVFQLNHLSA